MTQKHSAANLGTKGQGMYLMDLRKRPREGDGDMGGNVLPLRDGFPAPRTASFPEATATEGC